MPRSFPRDVIHWSEERIHPLRAFAIRTIEPAGITAVALRLWRVVLLSTDQWLLFVVGLTAAVLALCGMLAWHLANFPLRHWPPRVAVFFVVEVVVEMGVSSLLIAVGRERIGSLPATWNDWWPMAAHTLVQRGAVIFVFALVLALAVRLVRQRIDARARTNIQPQSLSNHGS